VVIGKQLDQFIDTMKNAIKELEDLDQYSIVSSDVDDIDIITGTVVDSAEHLLKEVTKFQTYKGEY
jgi:hypothetical protein